MKKDYKKEGFKINLQLFADGEPTGGAGDALNGGTQSSNDTNDTFTLDDFNNFLESNVEAQKILQSRIDSAVSKGVESFKQNKMPKLIQEEINKRSSKTPEQLQLEEMKQEIEKMKQENTRKTIETEIAKQADKLGIEVDFALDFCIDSTSLENTLEKVNKFNEYVEKIVEERVQTSVNERFKQNYNKPQQNISLENNTTSNYNSLDIIKQQLGK
ncbi:hypothetical protein CLPU_3c00870 [Gottschalkia purinilytica]|uniref:DUF4355 domain-containing protein n=1 Tax=Gottschalkia purinilytica TaxID=1503 RepID=A0A0L0WCV1_GOTPU|nr:DUF4355 domain-containing protein [Gottschalkia purinilytica]KNF09309.1 hypothetical protein CLPU_3c00870 [Gottschalkia purinilytica]